MPSSTITFEVTGICSGGGHATILIKRGGMEIGSHHVYISDMKEQALKNDVIKGIKSLALEMIKTANPATLPELKALIDSMTITVGWPG